MVSPALSAAAPSVTGNIKRQHGWRISGDYVTIHNQQLFHFDAHFPAALPHRAVDDQVIGNSGMSAQIQDNNVAAAGSFADRGAERKGCRPAAYG